MLETKNAKITHITLSNADHGILSSYLTLDYGGSGQGFGGYCLYNPTYKNDDITGFWIWRIMEVVGVDEWKDLVGKNIRVIGDYSHIEAIGNIIKDEWFYPQREFEELKR